MSPPFILVGLEPLAPQQGEEVRKAEQRVHAASRMKRPRASRGRMKRSS